MQSTKPGEAHVPVKPSRIAADFLLLAAAGIIAGLMTAAAGAAIVILLSSSGNAQDARALDAVVRATAMP